VRRAAHRSQSVAGCRAAVQRCGVGVRQGGEEVAAEVHRRSPLSSPLDAPIPWHAMKTPLVVASWARASRLSGGDPNPVSYVEADRLGTVCPSGASTQRPGADSRAAYCGAVSTDRRENKGEGRRFPQRRAWSMECRLHCIDDGTRRRQRILCCTAADTDRPPPP